MAGAYASPLPLFDDDIYFQPRGQLSTDKRDFTRKIEANPSNAPYFFSHALSAELRAEEPAAEPEDREELNTSQSLSLSFNDLSRWMNEEESDAQLLRMRMSSLQGSMGASAGLNASKGPSKFAPSNGPPSQSDFEDELHQLLRVLQLRDAHQIRDEEAAIAKEIRQIIQQQANASVHAVSHLKLTRLLHYYASLQNGLALMDAANGISLVAGHGDAQVHDDDAALPSDEIFAARRESDGFSQDAFDLAGGDSPGPALDLVALSEPHTVEHHKRKLDSLLQELALLPGTTIADVDARLAEAEEAFLETLQRIQTDVAKGEIATTVSSFAAAAAEQRAVHDVSALHWRDREEIQERRLYLHKLMEVHELLTASEEALARKKLSKVLSPKKLRSTRPPVVASSKKKRSAAAVRRPAPQTAKPPMSFALSSSASSAVLSAPQRRASVALSAFQPSLDLVPPITAEKLQQSARRAAEYQAIAEEEARQQQRRQDEQRRYSEWMSPRPATVSSPHTSPSPTTVHRRVPVPAAASSPTSSPEPMRADSLSPSSSLSPIAGLALLQRSQSPTLPRPSSSPPSTRLQRPTSPLLFTSPAPPRVYQSPFLSPNVHQATTKAATSSPPSWASPIAPQLTTSMLATGEQGDAFGSFQRSPAGVQSPSPSRSRVVLASSTVATPSTPSTTLYVSSSTIHPSPGSPLKSPLPVAAAPAATSTPTPPAPPAAPTSSPTLRRFASPSNASSSRSPAVTPATPTGTSTASVTYAPSTRATTSASKPLLRATKSFTEKDAETLAALLDGLNLNRYASRAELDHALHVKQTELHDALTQGRGNDVVAKIKAQMESMRAAYRLVALRG